MSKIDWNKNKILWNVCISDINQTKMLSEYWLNFECIYVVAAWNKLEAIKSTTKLKIGYSCINGSKV